jgi:hypothetical protein
MQLALRTQCVLRKLASSSQKGTIQKKNIPIKNKSSNLKYKYYVTDFRFERIYIYIIYIYIYHVVVRPKILLFRPDTTEN